MAPLEYRQRPVEIRSGRPRTEANEPKLMKMKPVMKMQRFMIICTLSGCVALVGCGSEKNTLIGAGDPEAAAAYDQLIEEQKMGAKDMAKVEQEMKKPQEEPSGQPISDSPSEDSN